MKWLTNLFASKPREPEIVHPVFGAMTSGQSHDGSTFWQTDDDFDSTLGPISMTIDGTRDGPSEDLVTSWQGIVADFTKWKAKAEPKLRETLRDFGHEDKFDELKLEGFGMHAVGRQPIDWDMSFELESEFMLFTVCFKDGEPTIVHADS